MRHTTFADTEPLPHRFHVQYTIRKGTVFPCTPAQPIASNLPGPVRCTVDENVWSMDGTTVLLPKGTQVNGTIEKGIGTGENRLFIVWTDALTPAPDLLAIQMEAPAADELGQSGAPGDVDTHLWQRIKAALLLSLVDLAGDAASSAASSGRGNTVLNLGSISSTTSSLGQMAFAHDINIPPTLYRAQGQPLTVYVPSYIDLVHFYRNVPVSATR
jgi:type IV secretion system protein VirB10